ncbi:hypothetical protein CHARACLAT_026659 [Characodon lateralis]|uniref:Uncharacterized protein n=1 Tax=Characodon lateralis TaxID=208331 RepID=A0ABU7DXN1_9TELE|nr:hypothetical protein [Characodon lateralis]
MLWSLEVKQNFGSYSVSDPFIGSLSSCLPLLPLSSFPVSSSLISYFLFPAASFLFPDGLWSSRTSSPCSSDNTGMLLWLFSRRDGVRGNQQLLDKDVFLCVGIFVLF